MKHSTTTRSPFETLSNNISFASTPSRFPHHSINRMITSNTKLKFDSWAMPNKLFRKWAMLPDALSGRRIKKSISRSSHQQVIVFKWWTTGYKIHKGRMCLNSPNECAIILRLCQAMILSGNGI